MQVDQGHLPGRDEVARVRLDVEEVLLELRELAAADQAVPLHQERRQHLGVAVLPGVKVEHEGGERPLQARAQPHVGHEARAGQLGAALEVENPELGADVPVVPGFEVEAGRFADDPLDPVGRLVGAHRNRLVGDVRHLEFGLRQLPFGLLDGLLELVDADLEPGHL